MNAHMKYIFVLDLACHLFVALAKYISTKKDD